MIDIRVPALGESITEAAIARWHKKEQEWIAQDELLLELETDKVTLEVTAPAAGIIVSLKAAINDYVKVGDVIAHIDDTASQQVPIQAPIVPVAPSVIAPPDAKPLSPSVRRLIDEYRIDPHLVDATGPHRTITKGDVLSYIERNHLQPSTPQVMMPPPVTPVAKPTTDKRSTDRKPLSRLRHTIAQRLKEAQNTAAILTTFNEIDMTPVIDMRAHHQEEFQKTHGIKLGFMPFFVRACVSALHKYPEVNGRIEGQDIVLPHYCDVGVAVGTDFGLVVPIIRDAQELDFVDIERTIADFGARAKAGKLTPDDMTGGTFTISNGGTYGSLLSTPILNPPQSGILGMHKIQKRPMVMEDDSIHVRHMMYVALSYDHRLIDGKGAVGFLVHVKMMLENPERLLLGL